MFADLGWMAERWPGLEHVIVTASAAGYRADGQLIMAEEELVTVRYQLRCDADWRFTGLDISVTSAAGHRDLAVSADGAGSWTAGGQPRPDLSGCTDIDINCTPLTNTLPIRRIAWSPGDAHDLEVAYVSVPELEVRAVRQRYTLLDAGERSGGARYRYESGSFRSDLRVDRDGWVTDYPGIWHRVGLGHPGRPGGPA
jgi:hypothetical protein